MIQIKMLKDLNGMLRNHIYNVSEIDAQTLTDHGRSPKFIKGDDGKWVQDGWYGGTGDWAVYYSKDCDELNGTLAPPMDAIPAQLSNCRLLQVSDEKAPFGQAWQKSNNTVKNIDFMNYIYDHEKYGVLCGWDSTNEHYLVVIDFDNDDVQREVLENGVLPETFTCKTARKGLYHLYFYTTDPIKKWKILTKDKDTLADIQAESTQVIGPGSRIPDGRCYEVVKDLPIATIAPSLLHKALDQFNYTKIEETLQQIETDGLTLSDFEKSYGDDKALMEVRRQLKINDILRDASISTSRNPTKCPFHSSKGGKCLGFDNNKGIWNCFHCLEHGTAIDLWMKINRVETFIDAKKQLCEKFGIKDTFVADKIKEANPKNSLPMVRLPQDTYKLTDFATDLAQYFKGDETIFFKPDEKNIVEITKYMDKLLKREIIGFSAVSPVRLLALIDERVNTYTLMTIKKDEVMVVKSPKEQDIKLLSATNTFINILYPIKRFLSYPIPFLDNGELIIPKYQPGRGYYDERFQAYFTADCPELKLIPINEAIFLLKDMLSEFCFKDPIDTVMALAYIITPMCRGLYTKPTARTPIFIIQANRERAGKDYLAGIRGILYEGQAIDDTPMVTGEKNESNNEELRKKFTAALKVGRRLYHSSNNRGFLNNASLESFSTSEVWRDRELGKSTQLELSNEVDISLSANLGLTYTPDLHHRSRPINLFYSEENPNERIYTRTDLHGYVLQNRSMLLSAIYSLIYTWVVAGRPTSKSPFTSYPEWARVIGGIMTYHKMGDPCITIDDTANVGGDRETQAMKDFCGFMAIHQNNDPEQQPKENPKGYTISRLRNIVIDAQSHEEIEGFGHWDLSDRSDQTKFGNLIKRFVGRAFHCKHQIKFRDKDGVDEWTRFKVTLEIAKDNDRSNKIMYRFHIDYEKDKQVKLEMERPEKDNGIVEESIEESLPKLNFDQAKMLLHSRKASLGSNARIYVGDLNSLGISDDVIKELADAGEIYTMTGGYVGLM